MNAVQPRRRTAKWAVALFFLAPLVGEFLLGNLPLSMLWTLSLLAPLYGGGALLIRETVRHLRLGWPSVVLLGLAYAVIEEGLVTQSLFNPNYVGLRLLDYGYIPSLGIGAWWTVFVCTLHAVWSTAVPIALVEALAGTERRTPWLGKVGFALTFVLFILGCLGARLAPEGDNFSASAGQLVMAAAVAVFIAVVALVWHGRPGAKLPSAIPCPRPLSIGMLSLFMSSAFMGLAILVDYISAWLNVSAMLLLISFFGCLLVRWARSKNWSASHECATAAGFALTYVWYGFVQVPSAGDVSPAADAIGNSVLGLAALALLAVAWRNTQRVAE